MKFRPKILNVVAPVFNPNGSNDIWIHFPFFSLQAHQLPLRQPSSYHKKTSNTRICKFGRTPLRGGLPSLIELMLHPVLSRIFYAFPGHMLRVKNRPTKQVSSKELVSPIYAPSIRSDLCRPNRRGQKETAANWTSQFEPTSQSQLLS